jgi:AcrR family transcriptional regulator
MTNDLKLKTAHLRRQHILEAAIRVFDARGFRGATIRDIATEAGVADGTVYNVFANKEALLLAILEPLLQASPPAPVPIPVPTNPPADLGSFDFEPMLRGMITARWDSLTPALLSMMRIVWSEALINRDLARQYREHVLAPAIETPGPLFQALADRSAIAASDIPMTLRLVVASFLGLALLKMLGDDVLDARSDDVARHLADLLANGLLPRDQPGAGHGSV